MRGHHPVSSDRAQRDTGRNPGGSRIPAVTILGIPVHGITMEETLDVMKAMALSGESHHAMTVNPEFIMIARKDH